MFILKPQLKPCELECGTSRVFLLAPMQMNCGAQAGDGSTALQFSNASWLLIATKLDSRNGPIQSDVEFWSLAVERN